MTRSRSCAARRRISLIARVPHSICIPSYTPSTFSLGEHVVKRPLLETSENQNDWLAIRPAKGDGRSSGGNGPSRSSAQALLTGLEIRVDVQGALPVYRRTRGAASCRLGDSVAEIGVNGAVCHIGASNLIPVLLPRSWGSGSYEVGKCRWVRPLSQGLLPGMDLARVDFKPAGQLCNRVLPLERGQSHFGLEDWPVLYGRPWEVPQNRNQPCRTV